MTTIIAFPINPAAAAYLLHLAMRKYTDDDWSVVTWNAVHELPQAQWIAMVTPLCEDAKAQGGLSMPLLWAWFSDPPDGRMVVDDDILSNQQRMAMRYLRAGLRCALYAQVLALFRAIDWHHREADAA